MFTSAFALVTSFLAATSAAAAVAPCQDPEGLQWAIYPNPYYKQSTTYKSFNPTIIKSETPEESGVTGDVDVYAEYSYEYFYPYGGSEYFSTEHFIIDHRGYIKAPVTGIYNFTVTETDNIVLLWLHSVAYSGWNRKNALLVTNNEANTPPLTFSFRLKKGIYSPIRFIWANNAGPVNLAVQLTDPNGNLLIGGDTALNSAIVQYSCSGTVAPPFQPYGSEQ